ncbi:SpvB/TcaC N-terminal domain-containing protein [Leptodesmis sichuanensis]|uniref:SpvB/TcaC N-terminal domain-containing protein n=1 Tax=Leptodesmis sichuanensis TaxID=2906798 RepID=UPI001F2D1F0A|nr:SpvB/TcaC N-terminal domain-containing protein [Leptodesmis sichuanensis]UIE37907.1 toxin [Leptodesmis sichuanensis A121]
MPTSSKDPGNGQASESNKSYYSPPAAVELPKGGGAIRGIGEKFAVNPVTGTGSLSLPIFTTPSRSGFSPQLSLSYDSGAGNGVFGLGWNLSVPSVTRKTDKGLPRYFDGEDSDVFILSGVEDLVPVLVWGEDGETWEEEKVSDKTEETETYTIRRYRPRIEGLFARIERWQHRVTGAIHWRSLSKDNITSIYGRSPDLLHSQIADPKDASRVFKWMLEASYDDRGNLIVYQYKPENDAKVDKSEVYESHRVAQDYKANVYLKRIWYGNRTPYRQATHSPRKDYLDIIRDQEDDWLFQVVFDYGEHGSDDSRLDVGNWAALRPEDLASDTPTPDEGRSWPIRPDAFSTYRAGFEVRTQRLCRRVLMFHRMDETGEIGDDWHLVRSTDFGYEKDPVATYLVAAKQTGYVLEGAGYRRRWMPPLEMRYDRPQFDSAIKTVDPESLENLPIGLDSSQYQWVDLDSEGISGILTEQGTGWFYKRNLGAAQFGPAELVTTKPSVAVLQSPQQRVMDLAGDGTQDIVLLGALTGYYQREADGEWRNFQAFESVPNVDWNDPNLRFVDLNGDGHADILITQDELFVWYPSQARQGFGAAETVRKAQDEEQGPALVFSDRTQSIYLADMSGDGLNDLVRIRNGEVCYWPSLGYGRFGARVTMAGAPWFDHPELFDQKRVRLADIDGSGTTDILYLGREEIAIWLNQAGNGFRQYGREDGETPLTQFPTVDDLTAVQAIDLLGNGTACLVWSSSLPGQSWQPMKYIDLMGGQKPHLMTSVVNNLGAETKLQYAASTKFYLQDRREGTPWITRLPFPVHVVERVETIDHLTGNRFVSLYRYRHGYFDGEEREFRGFGYVEQWDTEEYAEFAAGKLFAAGTNTDAGFHVPPVQTKTWFHTGAFIDREHLSTYFAETEYYREPRHRIPENATETDRQRIEAEFEAMLLPDTVLPGGLTLPDGTGILHRLTAQEEREACRALKGSVLRQEVYALDGTAEAEHPYTVTESNYEIRQIQPRRGDQYGVFFVHPRESLAYHYERHPADPRVAHQMTLEVDGFGNVLKSVAIAYPRRRPLSGEDTRYEEQKPTYITYIENRVTNKPNELDWYRIGLPVETCTYEITGIEGEGLPNFIPLTLDRIREQLSLATPLLYEAFATSGMQRRLVEQVRVLYRANAEANTIDPTPLPLGAVDSLALPYETYRLAFTPGLLDGVFSEVADPVELRALLQKTGEAGGGPTDGGGYIELDGNWWIPSGRQAFDPELFYLPRMTKDPFEQEYRLTYDIYPLLVRQTEAPLNTVVTIENNYRVMQPWRITDPNGNRAQVAFDTLGMVVGTAVMGKVGDPTPQGDSLETFTPDLPQDAIDRFFANPLGTAVDHLGTATTRIIYELDRYQQSGQPVYAATLARETHVSDLQSGTISKVQVSFLYSDGFGRELQTKVQAEPGPAPVRDANGVLKCNENLVHTDPRWVGTGRTIYNNKGKPVRQYEPFFSPTHLYEDEPDLVECGVTPILFYDPLERVVATLHPNHTYDKVVFDPWQQATWDVNDTLTLETREDPTRDPDVGFYFQRLGTADYLPTWYSRYSTGTASDRDAATKATAHAGTPSRVHLDTLGRPFLTLAHNGWDATGAEQLYETRVEQDIEGQQLKITDARCNDVMVYVHRTAAGQETRGYDLLGHGLYSHSMDAGERWTLNNVAGNPIRGWTWFGDPTNPQLRTVRTTYDALQRPRQLWVQQGDETELLAEQTVYGEEKTNPEATNHRGKVWRVYDQAGIVTSEDYDFKGNLWHSTRQLTAAYKQAVNWAASPVMEAPIYRSETAYDALNRPIRLLTPHTDEIPASIVRPVYNEANLLEQVQVNLRGAATATTFVSNIDYNAKGQRILIDYGNHGVTTEYHYYPDTFRLHKLLTRREEGPWLQNLHYTYDPVGNITEIRDSAQQTIFFRNARVEPVNQYRYDPLYQLVEATGREHIGQSTPNGSEQRPDLKPHYDFNDSTRRNLPHPNDAQAMRHYTETYDYDAVGNILAMIHQATGSDWTRHYAYAPNSNRLLSTSLPGDRDHEPLPPRYFYDIHGNMTQMPHLPVMEWDFKDQLQATQKQVVNPGNGAEKTYYVYDAGGQRVRKVTERANGTRKNERLYLGGFELYREYDGSGNTPTLERETLHMMDDQQRIALVETQTLERQDNGTVDTVPESVIRYQVNNHLGSASLELDAAGAIISYEEYYPYGSTSYQAGRSGTEVSLKRYRYTGKERDEESGLYYHGARYYAAWLGRWTSCDPAGIYTSTNVYQYVASNPISLKDPSGTQEEVSTLEREALWATYFRPVYASRRVAEFVKNLRNKDIFYGIASKYRGEKFQPSSTYWTRSSFQRLKKSQGKEAGKLGKLPELWTPEKSPSQLISEVEATGKRMEMSCIGLLLLAVARYYEEMHDRETYVEIEKEVRESIGQGKPVPEGRGNVLLRKLVEKGWYTFYLNKIDPEHRSVEKNKQVPPKGESSKPVKGISGDLISVETPVHFISKPERLKELLAYVPFAVGITKSSDPQGGWGYHTFLVINGKVYQALWKEESHVIGEKDFEKFVRGWEALTIAIPPGFLPFNMPLVYPVDVSVVEPEGHSPDLDAPLKH